MSELLDSICSTFTKRLHWWVGEIQDYGAKPKKQDWIEKLLVFFALEDCQSLLTNEAKRPKVWCRFSMGSSKRKAKNKDRKLLQDLIKTARADHLKKDFAKEAVDKLSEFLVDLSISSHKLEHADGSNTDEPFPDDEKFRLLLVAESEMGSKAEVLRDFLKLTCIECPIKVMVYKAVEQGEREAMKDAFLNVIANARREQDGAEWLLVGIPGYKQWLDS